MSKIKLDNFVYYGSLFEVYGKLLSEDRQKIMTDYFSFNMTLAEIAKERNISRQAVADAIDKSCEKLQKFEDLLCVLGRRQKLTKNLEELQCILPKEYKEKVEKILQEI